MIEQYGYLFMYLLVAYYTFRLLEIAVLRNQDHYHQNYNDCFWCFHIIGGENICVFLKNKLASWSTRVIKMDGMVVDEMMTVEVDGIVTTSGDDATTIDSGDEKQATLKMNKIQIKKDRADNCKNNILCMDYCTIREWKGSTALDSLFQKVGETSLLTILNVIHGMNNTRKPIL